MSETGMPFFLILAALLLFVFASVEADAIDQLTGDINGRSRET
jgi:hypothetical protein